MSALGIILSVSMVRCAVTMDIPFCPGHRPGPVLNVTGMAGTWRTVYSQPMAVDCFNLQLHPTTVLERDLHLLKYGDFGGAVNWAICMMEVLSNPNVKHFLQGDGSDSGLLENIIITVNIDGTFRLSKTADQWAKFGSPGKEVLLMRQCYGSVSAAFARPDAWPTAVELNIILHKNGIVLPKISGMLCQEHGMERPYNFTARLF